MPRPTHAMGRPGTAVIPDDWATTGQAVAKKTLPDLVTLRHPGTTRDYNSTSKVTESTPLPPYAMSVPARIQVLQAEERTEEVAGDTVHVRGYSVVVAADQVAAVNDLVLIQATSDTALTGKTLRVRDVVRGSVRFERELLCTLDN